jgi:glycosyltransferase involved in cell wall biosynthesis
MMKQICVRLVGLMLISIFTVNTSFGRPSLKIGFLSSWQIRCGIATYTKHHYDALVNRGHRVTVYDYALSQEELLEKIQQDALDIFHVQYERGFLPHQPVSQFVEFLYQVKKLGVKVIVTMHSEEICTLDVVQAADRCIYHKEPIYTSKSSSCQLHVVSHGVPLYTPCVSREHLREKYGFAPHEKVLTTFGFLVSWKNHAEILSLLAPLLKQNPHYKVQLLTAFNDYDPAACLAEKIKIKNIIETNDLEKQVVHITEFLPEHEVHERLYCSDLGYLWGDVNSTSSSGAFKQFIAARLPFVVTECTHYPRITSGIIRTPVNKEHFITCIEETLREANLDQLRIKLEELYNQLNYEKIITQHIAIYTQALAS